MWQPTIRTIGDILRESINQYAIPPFQRAYKWGEEEAIELVEDLKSFPEAGEEYLFLGNFILEKPIVFLKPTRQYLPIRAIFRI